VQNGEAEIIAGVIIAGASSSDARVMKRLLRLLQDHKHKRPSPKGRPFVFRNCRSLAIDNDRATVVIPVSVVVTILPNNDRFATIAAVPIPIVFTVTVTIPITMDHTDSHATTADADTDFFRPGRHCAANTHHGGQCGCILDHCVLPMNVKLRSQSVATPNVPKKPENSWYRRSEAPA